MLSLRGKGTRFRQWLASEAELERDVLAAYLGELAAADGWKRNLGKVINAAGMFGGAATGAALGGPLGAVGGAIAGEGLAYVANLAAQLDGGWKPKLFGQAVRVEVERTLRRG